MANERKERKERSGSLLAVKSLTNCSAVDPRRHALHEALADFRQRLARIELSCQTNAAEAAEGVDVALRAEILNGLDAGNQTHLRSTNQMYWPNKRQTFDDLCIARKPLKSNLSVNIQLMY